MSGKERIEQLLKALENENTKMRDQTMHLNGQIAYNQRVQEILNQQLRELINDEDEIKTTSKSKTIKKKK